MATATEGTTFSVDFVLTTNKNGTSRKVYGGNKIRHFVTTARESDIMTYHDFLSPDFSSNDFYPLVDMAIAIGVVQKQGSKYHFASDFKTKFTEVLNDCILGTAI